MTEVRASEEFEKMAARTIVSVQVLLRESSGKTKSAGPRRWFLGSTDSCAAMAATMFYTVAYQHVSMTEEAQE